MNNSIRQFGKKQTKIFHQINNKKKKIQEKKQYKSL